jgi:hypothetical protein
MSERMYHVAVNQTGLYFIPPSPKSSDIALRLNSVFPHVGNEVLALSGRYVTFIGSDRGKPLSGSSSKGKQLIRA